MSRSPRILILHFSSAYGLKHDGLFVESSLQGAAVVRFGRFSQRSRFRRLVKLFWLRAQGWNPDLVVHLEAPFRDALWLFGRHAVIPNPENFQLKWHGAGSRFAVALGKTRCATEAFRGIGYPAVYTGFSSPDVCDLSVVPNYSLCLHLAGKAWAKGTQAVIEAWLRHPHWPEILIGLHPDNFAGDPMLAAAARAPNIRLERGLFPQEQVRRWQNERGIHVYPSIAEGFGHALVEGLSARAVVVTTDGEPMNEIVEPSYGRIVPVSRRGPHNLGRNHLVSPEGLDAVLGDLWRQPAEELQRTGERARAVYIERDGEARRRIRDALLQAAVRPRR